MPDQLIEPASRDRWLVRPGTARAVAEEMDASYRAAATIHGAYQLAREIMNQTYELECQAEYLMRQAEQAGSSGADLLYSRLLRKQELFDKAIEEVLTHYVQHDTNVRRVTNYQYGYREERGGGA